MWASSSSTVGSCLAASSIAIHNEILHTRPDLLEVLYQPFTWSMQQQERPGEPPYYQQPIFMMHNGYFVCRYVQGHIKSAQRFPEVPRLTDAQNELLRVNVWGYTVLIIVVTAVQATPVQRATFRSPLVAS